MGGRELLCGDGAKGVRKRPRAWGSMFYASHPYPLHFVPSTRVFRSSIGCSFSSRQEHTVSSCPFCCPGPHLLGSTGVHWGPHLLGPHTREPGARPVELSRVMLPSQSSPPASFVATPQPGLARACPGPHTPPHLSGGPGSPLSLNPHSPSLFSYGPAAQCACAQGKYSTYVQPCSSLAHTAPQSLPAACRAKCPCRGGVLGVRVLGFRV